jgi:poly(3-hydroxybutyrate) depolymerase
MPPRVAIAASHVALAVAACSSADGRTGRTEAVTISPPCPGCLVEVPPAAGERPAVVIAMHGNNETAADAAKRWRAAAAARGHVLLALECPRDQGCDGGKWYEWPKTTAYVRRALETLDKQLPIDRDRVYLIGWSGGASAIGRHLAAWDDFATAIVLHGGGMPPVDGRCANVPAYFLVGDANPGHRAAVALRQHLAKCGSEVEWDVMPDADHAAEDAALDRTKASKIISWLDDRARTET